MNRVVNQPKIKLGIALSGGAARGIAHIGVLRALEEQGLAPEVVAGTSMGAIVGMLYAAGIVPDDIQRMLKKEKIYNVLGFSFLKNGLFNMNPLKEIFEEALEGSDFSILKKDFYVAVSNLNTGRGEIHSEGSNLFEYVIASASIPFIFPPQEINGQTYIDGGLFNNLPSEPLVGRCDRIIGVHVNFNGLEKEIKGTKTIVERSFHLAIEQNVKLSRSYCDYYMEPRELKEFSSWDYDKVDQIVEIGYESAMKSIQQFILPELEEAYT